MLMACVAGGLAFSRPPVADDQPKLPDGISSKDLNDQKDERSVLAKAVNAAFTKGGFDDMVERLATPDRQRIGEFSEQEFKELDGRIEQIRKNWKEKYGQDFDASSEKLLDGFVVIHEGEVTDPTAAKNNWPVAATNGRKNGGESNTADSVKALDKGRNVAIVWVPNSHDLRGIIMSMIHESIDDWRIDIPDTITGQQVYGNVKNALTQVGDNSAFWPADVNDAYRFVGHTVFMALYDVPVEIGNTRRAENN